MDSNQMDMFMSDKVKTNESDNSNLIDSFVIKAVETSNILSTSNKVMEDEFSKSGLNNKLLPPPYDPWKLSVMAEQSSILGQCIDVMEVNCDSFGYDFEPSTDDETFKEIKEAQEKLYGENNENEVDFEYNQLKNFFKYINRTLSYTQLKRRTKRDYELTGNGYWEILRNHLTQQITGAEWLPSPTMRLARIDKKFTNYMAKRKVSDTIIETYPDKKKFRRFAQIKESGNKPVWFKEFGDPRIMDAETGAYAVIERNDRGFITTITPEPVDSNWPAFDVVKFKSGKMTLATEILHFVNYNSSRALPYGTPRWIGNLISIMGSRASEEVNYMYFDNKTVPPGMLLVSGGKLTKSTVDRVTNHIRDHIKGQKNYHSMLVVEAHSKIDNPNMPAPTSPKLEWVPMKDAQNSDSLYQKYDQQNIDKIVSSFRFWPGFVGRVKDVNRATADTARKLSEEQVFEPERMEFDSIINRSILVEMGINYWEHKSKGPQLSTPQDKAELADNFKGSMTIKELRLVAGQVFNKELEELEDTPWAEFPITMLESMLKNPKLLPMLIPGDLGNKLTEALEMDKTREHELKMREQDLKAQQPNPAGPGQPSNDDLSKDEVAKLLKNMLTVKKALEDPDTLNASIGRNK